MFNSLIEITFKFWNISERSKKPRLFSIRCSQVPKSRLSLQTNRSFVLFSYRARGGSTCTELWDFSEETPKQLRLPDLGSFQFRIFFYRGSFSEAAWHDIDKRFFGGDSIVKCLGYVLTLPLLKILTDVWRYGETWAKMCPNRPIFEFGAKTWITDF